MRFRTALAVAAVAAPSLALPAQAKDGVRATLDAPVKLGTKAGRTMVVKFHLSDAEGHHFGASGIYLRVSRCSGKRMHVYATDRGKGYTATFKVPKGGIRKLMVGLEGWQTTPTFTRRADATFNFVPALGRRCG